MGNNNIFDDKAISAIINNISVRQQVAKESHYIFFNIYFPDYIKFPFAEFQKDIFKITEDKSNKLACVVAFRNSGKSTLVSTSYTLWSILGIQQKKFVVIVCQTQAQARQQMANIKYALENNSLLRNDLGPFQQDNGSEEWSISSLVFQNTGARITVASTEQSIRGIRHRQHRPDLVILDDIENVSSTRNIENRNKLFEWFTREIAPLGDMGTRIMIVGNLVHEDSLLMRIKNKIESKELKGIYRSFPLIEQNGTCLWPEKFDTPEKIENLRQSVVSQLAWEQEYLLRPVSENDKIVDTKWIKKYKDLPENNPEMKDEWELSFACTAVDPAFTQKETSDYSATVSGLVYVSKKTDHTRIYILPWITKAKLTEEGLIKRVKDLINVVGINDHRVFVEGGGAQILVTQHMQDAGLNATDIPTRGLNKAERLYPAAGHVERGNVWFPERGTDRDDLIKDITDFPAGASDDLVDAFSMLVNKGLEMRKTPGIISYYKNLSEEAKKNPPLEKEGGYTLDDIRRIYGL